MTYKTGTIRYIGIKDISLFTSSVFGADCFLRNFPELCTTGARVMKFQNHWNIIDDSNKIIKTVFFTYEEIKICMKFLKGV